MVYHRRKSDLSKWGQFKYVVVDGDISMTLVLGGLGLMLWAVFGMFMFVNDLDAYAKMFPYGNGYFWAGNYLVCGLAMWWLVGAQFPAFASLVIGGWVSVIWTWAALARMTATATMQTGNATSVIYIILGLLIIQRSARK